MLILYLLIIHIMLVINLYILSMLCEALSASLHKEPIYFLSFIISLNENSDKEKTPNFLLL